MTDDPNTLDVWLEGRFAGQLHRLDGAHREDWGRTRMILNRKFVTVVAAVALAMSGALVTVGTSAVPAFASSKKLVKPIPKKVANKTYYVGQTVTVKGKHMSNVNRVKVGAKIAKITKRKASYIKIRVPKVTKGTKTHLYKLAFYYPKTKAKWSKSFHAVKSQRIKVAGEWSMTVSGPAMTKPTPPKPVGPNAHVRLNPGTATSYPMGASTTACTPDTATVIGLTGTIWDETCATIRDFADEYNSLRSANEMAKVPLDHFIPGNNVTEREAQGTTGDPKAAIVWTKQVAAGAKPFGHDNAGINFKFNNYAREVAAESSHTGSGAVDFPSSMGSTAAGGWWMSLGHRYSIYYNSPTGQFNPTRWWSRAAQIANIKSEYADDPETLEYYASHDYPGTREDCIYYVAAVNVINDSQISEAAYASPGVCPSEGVVPDGE